MELATFWVFLWNRSNVCVDAKESSNEFNCFSKAWLFDRLGPIFAIFALWQYKGWRKCVIDNVLDELRHAVNHLSGRIDKLGAASRVSDVHTFRSGRVGADEEDYHVDLEVTHAVSSGRDSDLARNICVRIVRRTFLFFDDFLQVQLHQIPMLLIQLPLAMCESP